MPDRPAPMTMASKSSSAVSEVGGIMSDALVMDA
jgi:hypothetical protein